ncbi:M15 family metallopeptidase [Clostridium sp. AF22-10]|uniref:M15 family metallopeptidase n=1 Tax=unclassified Clostridium TaxID=2614128 RepID=UPI0026A44904
MRDITLCHPRLQRIASAWIKACATEGITVAIGETLRTVAEQDALYAQGRTKPGNIVTNAKGSSYSSQHQWGLLLIFILRWMWTAMAACQTMPTMTAQVCLKRPQSWQKL